MKDSGVSVEQILTDDCDNVATKLASVSFETLPGRFSVW